jgi:hypothetical protein
MVGKVIFTEVNRSGLGDVLLGFISSYWLSKILKSELYTTNCHILNIFNIESIENIENPIVLKIFDDVKMYKYLKDENMVEKYQKENLVITSNQNFYSIFYENNSVKDIIKELCPDVTDCIKIFFENIRYKDYIQNRIDLLNIPENIIGLHIRLYRDYPGDGIYLSEKTIHQFESVLDILEKNKNNPVFISTDTMDVFDNFKDRNIIRTDKNIPKHCDYDRSLDNDIKSFIDLYAIGLCREVIISYWSNFSRIGVLRTKIPFYIVPLLIPEHLINNSWMKQYDGMVNKGAFNITYTSNELYRKGEHSEILSKHKNF